VSKVCSVDGCSAKHKARGYCDIHYRRFLKYGDPHGGPTKQGEALDFLFNVALTYQGGDCLHWPYSRRRDGRGQVAYDGRPQIASRVVCILAHGPAPTPNHEAAHNCGNGHLACVNPNHLRWDTRKGNAGDMAIHGTLRTGELNNWSKITHKIAAEIRSMKGTASNAQIAVRFGVSKSTVGRVMRGDNWHIQKESAA